MNAWFSRCGEKLHFADLALDAAEEAGASTALDAAARVMMCRESAAMHARGAWLALLNGVAEQLNLPTTDFPDVTELLQQADARGVDAEVLREIRMLAAKPGSWPNRLERAWQAVWRPRATGGPEPGSPGLIAFSGAGDGSGEQLRECIARCREFSERHQGTMEEW